MLIAGQGRLSGIAGADDVPSPVQGQPVRPGGAGGK